MKRLTKYLLIILCFSIVACGSYKTILKNQNSVERKEDADIIKSANRILAYDNITIVEKQVIPPSGDKRDYITMSPYRWPNPKTENGLPYIFRDGEINPECRQYSDLRKLNQMIEYVEILSKAYGSTGDDNYAKRAAEFVRVFFIDKKTGMKPNLYYAQFIPGINDFQPSGITEMNHLPQFLNAVGKLSPSRGWPKSVSAGLKKWMGEFYIWMMTSEQGIAERNNPANIGTTYDYECLSILKYLGDKKEIKRFINDYTIPRLEKSVRADGGQPSELRRTLSFTYSCTNISTWILVADIADEYGVDISFALCNWKKAMGMETNKLRQGYSHK